MPKNKNAKSKRQDQKIGELCDQVRALTGLINAITALIQGLLAQTNKDIADLQYTTDGQYEIEMLQLTAIKRTLSIMNTAVAAAMI